MVDRVKTVKIEHNTPTPDLALIQNETATKRSSGEAKNVVMLKTARAPDVCSVPHKRQKAKQEWNSKYGRLTALIACFCYNRRQYLTWNLSCIAQATKPTNTFFLDKTTHDFLRFSFQPGTS